MTFELVVGVDVWTYRRCIDEKQLKTGSIVCHSSIVIIDVGVLPSIRPFGMYVIVGIFRINTSDAYRYYHTFPSIGRPSKCCLIVHKSWYYLMSESISIFNILPLMYWPLWNQFHLIINYPAMVIMKSLIANGLRRCLCDGVWVAVVLFQSRFSW